MYYILYIDEGFDKLRADRTTLLTVERPLLLLLLLLILLLMEAPRGVPGNKRLGKLENADTLEPSGAILLNTENDDMNVI